MTGQRRLSHAIAEGDGISVLVEVIDPDAARVAADQGAEGIVVRVPAGAIRDATSLPLLLYGPDPEGTVAGSADAVVVAAEEAGDRLADIVETLYDRGIECVLKVRDEDDLERVLEELDPEILLLSAEEAQDEQSAVDRLLELLPDVPAGKLAIAELRTASREEVEELERAGVDAVVVTSADVGALVGDLPPDV